MTEKTQKKKKESEEMKKRKKEMSAALNEFFGTDIEWTKLSEEELTSLGKSIELLMAKKTLPAQSSGPPDTEEDRGPFGFGFIGAARRALERLEKARPIRRLVKETLTEIVQKGVGE